MSVSMTLMNSANFVRPYLKNHPITVICSEPGIGAANIVLQMLTRPPFRWPWNRRNITFNTTTSPATTDYPTAISDYGFVETIWLQDSTGKMHGVNGALSLGVDANQSRPTQLAPQYDDGQGNITFRVKNTPDQVYKVFVDYQRRPSHIISFAQVWDVVPDHFSYSYNLGYLAFLSLLVNDARFPIYEKWFLSTILGAQDGLDDQGRDIFMSIWMNATRTAIRNQGAGQSGSAARGT